MVKQCEEAKQLGEPHGVLQTEGDDPDDDDGNLPDRCPLHRKQRKRWRDANWARRKAARERDEPEPPDAPWQPVSIRTGKKPIVLEVEDRDELSLLLSEVRVAAVAVRQALRRAGRGRYDNEVEAFTKALDDLDEQYQALLGRQGR